MTSTFRCQNGTVRTNTAQRTRLCSAHLLTDSLLYLLLAVCFSILCLQASGLYEYKVHGVMPDLDPEESARVYVDWEYRKIWDTYVIGE